MALDPAEGMLSEADLVADMLRERKLLRFEKSPMYKRIFDLIISLPLVCCFLFSLFWVVLLNPFLNKGDIFFAQERIGRGGEVFKIRKFRTMVGGSDNTKFQNEEKKRITAFGDFLRRTRIDELPQIWNVFMGDMSLIGPRPERPKFVIEYMERIPHYAQRLAVRPGISGLAQLRHGYTSDVIGTGRKLRWDLEYINRMSFRLDMVILGETARIVFGRMFFIDVKTKL